jgi:hypothetical protein
MSLILNDKGLGVNSRANLGQRKVTDVIRAVLTIAPTTGIRRARRRTMSLSGRRAGQPHFTIAAA